jgi:hypothetical protein
MHNEIARTNKPSMKAGSVWNLTSIHRPTKRNRKEEITRVKLQALMRMMWLRFLLFSLFFLIFFMAVTSFPVYPACSVREQAFRDCSLIALMFLLSSPYP